MTQPVPANNWREKSKTFIWQGRIKGKRSDDRLAFGRVDDIKTVAKAKDLCAAPKWLFPVAAVHTWTPAA